MRVDGHHYRSLWALPGQAAIAVIDQTRLPHEFRILRLESLHDVLHAIRVMQVRGAPLIGAAGAYGMALALRACADDKALEEATRLLVGARPTAVNLRWAIERVRQVLRDIPVAARADLAWQEAAILCEEDVALNQAIGEHGFDIVRQCHEVRGRPINILTHCNAGWLATVDWGTALAPVYRAHDAGIPLHVWVDETRPRNQGASLTAWELSRHGVPYTVVTDNAGGHLMQCGQVDLVMVGADRVTRHGDVCNKIGTYLKALAAFDNGVPFYAAVPSPSVDWSARDPLRDIPIEERAPQEVEEVTGRLPDGTLAAVAILPAGSVVANPAFDVTPARLVTALITERGVAPPEGLQDLFADIA